MKKVLVNIRKVWLAAALVGLMSVVLAACGGDSNAGTPTTAPAVATPTTGGSTGGDMKEYPVALKDFAIDPKDLTADAGKLRFVVTNEGGTAHDLVIEGKGGTPILKPGEGPVNLDVELAAGTYKWLCDIPGHAQRGMEGTLTVK